MRDRLFNYLIIFIIAIIFVGFVLVIGRQLYLLNTGQISEHEFWVRWFLINGGR